MNLHIDGQKFRFRISKSELETLCAKQKLAQHIFLPHQQIMHIFIATKEQEEILSFTFEKGGIKLYVQQTAAQNLYVALPSREGLQTEQPLDDNHVLQLLLEVDIRTQKRKRT